MDFWDTKKILQIVPFYNVLIEKPKIKHLPNIELLHELPFYDELCVVKNQMHLKDMQEAIVQFEASKSSTKDLFKNLLNEMKGSKYQITMKGLLYKHKMDGDKNIHLIILILQLKQ